MANQYYELLSWELEEHAEYKVDVKDTERLMKDSKM